MAQPRQPSADVTDDKAEQDAVSSAFSSAFASPPGKTETKEDGS